MASTRISRTQSGAESAAGRRTFTFSAWIKRTGLGGAELFGSDSDGARSNNYFIIDFNGTDQLDISEYVSGSQFRLTTTRQFRDTNSWYHLVVAFDTTQGTSSNRVKIYVNGVQETAFGTENYPSQDYQTRMFAQNKIHAFGRSGGHFDGLISHCHAAEGTAYAPTVFGETDSATGEWKINTTPTVSYGTNGFFLFKDDNAVTNQAGNSSGNFAVTAGTFTKTEDCPSNVFCTANPLDYNSVSHSIGNTKLNWSQSAGNFGLTTGTIGMTTGKYYWEAKITSADNSTGIGLGVIQTEPYLSRTTTTGVNTSLFYGLGARFATDKSISKTSNGVDSSISDTWSNDVIIRIAYDGDAGKIYMWKGTSEFNGQTFSSNTSFNDATLTAGTMVLPYFTFGDGGSGTKTSQVELNFGNGYFGTTAVSSAGTNASNIGIFEYDVPTGYTALSTKGLNE